MGFTPTEKIWFNGELVPWHEAKVHVLAHGLHYGTGVFEGMRSYKTAGGPAVFRLDAHLRRFYESAAMYEIEIPYSADILAAATLDVVRVNGLEDAYLRPIAFFDVSTLSVWTKDCPVTVAIAGFPFGKYLADSAHGVRVTVSPIRRFDANAIPSTGKACGQYINSVRAVQEAQRRGFDEAILLNSRGEVAEGSGENLFVVKNGVVRTNDAEAGILMGVTRASVLEIAADLGLPTDVGPINVEDPPVGRRAVLHGHGGRSDADSRGGRGHHRRRETGADHRPYSGDVLQGGSRGASAVPTVADDVGARSVVDSR